MNKFSKKQILIFDVKTKALIKECDSIKECSIFLNRSRATIYNHLHCYNIKTICNGRYYLKYADDEFQEPIEDYCREREKIELLFLRREKREEKRDFLLNKAKVKFFEKYRNKKLYRAIVGELQKIIEDFWFMEDKFFYYVRKNPNIINSQYLEYLEDLYYENDYEGSFLTLYEASQNWNDENTNKQSKVELKAYFENAFKRYLEEVKLDFSKKSKQYEIYLKKNIENNTETL